MKREDAFVGMRVDMTEKLTGEILPGTIAEMGSEWAGVQIDDMADLSTWRYEELRPAQREDILERPPIDWSQPVRWNTGEACTAERASGFILITLTDVPMALTGHLARRHFQDTVVVHEDSGVPVTTLAEYAPDCWVENVIRQRHHIEDFVGMF